MCWIAWVVSCLIFIMGADTASNGEFLKAVVLLGFSGVSFGMGYVFYRLFADL